MLGLKWIVLGAVCMSGAFAPHQVAADPIDVNTLVSGVRAIGHEVPEADRMVASCDGDAMCAARFLRDSIGPGAGILPAENTRPARTSWSDQKTPMRVIPDASSGGVLIEIVRLDFEFLSNIFNRLAVIPKKVILDIRDLEPSEELGDVRRTVGLFTGAIDRAFRLIYATGRQVDWKIPGQTTHLREVNLIVRLGPETPGNGIAFAALLERYRGATIEGGSIPDHIRVQRVVPIMHGWEMWVPSAEVSIPDP